MQNLSFQTNCNSDASNSFTPLYYHLEDAVTDKAVVNTIGDYNINTDSIFKIPVYITKEVVDIVLDYPDDAGQSLSGRLSDLFYMAYYRYINIKDDYEFLPHFFYRCIFLVPGEKRPYNKTYSFFMQFRDEIELGGDVILIGLRDQFDEDYAALIKG